MWRSRGSASHGRRSERRRLFLPLDYERPNVFDTSDQAFQKGLLCHGLPHQQLCMIDHAVLPAYRLAHAAASVTMSVNVVQAITAYGEQCLHFAFSFMFIGSSRVFNGSSKRV